MLGFRSQIGTGLPAGSLASGRWTFSPQTGGNLPPHRRRATGDLQRHSCSAERTVYEGVGEGGDRTLAIDRRCEDVVFAELERLAAAGASFVAVSEERGEVAFGSGGTARVVIDPIDGSLNARRTIPSHSLSIAVASGTSMADVEFGFVHDFGADEEFAARRGEGAQLGGGPTRVAAVAEKLEVVGLESAEPEWALPALEALAGRPIGCGSSARSRSPPPTSLPAASTRC